MATRHTTKPVPGGQTPSRGRRVLFTIFVFVVCVLAVDALVGDQGFVATIRARKQYNQLASDLARLRVENAGLNQEVRRLRDDPAAIEEIARRELGLMSPGETLFIVKDVADPAQKSQK
jgi:cell division protein FtsB